MKKTPKLLPVLLITFATAWFSYGCKKDPEIIKNQPDVQPQAEPLWKFILGSKFPAMGIPYITVDGNYLCFGNGNGLLRIDTKEN